jgi:HD-GYP domain-containing protein (c-di-GMP phosphodiesterase class II)
MNADNSIDGANDADYNCDANRRRRLVMTALSPRWWALWSAVLALPVAIGVVLYYVAPGWDPAGNPPGLHFYLVSSVALASMLACAIIVGLTQSLRETRLLFLGLAFLSIAAIFSVHGLGTPGHIHQDGYVAARASSWLSVFAGAVFIAANVVALPPRAEEWLERRGGFLLGGVTFALGLYIGVSIFIAGEWLDWLPVRDLKLQWTMTLATLGLLGFGAWRYFQAFLFARLFSQWAMVITLLLLMEVQALLMWGGGWQLMWLYHGVYALAFVVLFAGWFIEAKRAGTVRVLADALSMRDAISQLNQGYTRPIADLVDAIEWKDLYTLGHVRRVASYAVMTGKELGMSTLELRALAMAAQMHDVGKISVPDKILTKAARLTEEEFEVIKDHVSRGYEIAVQVPALHQAIEGILYHHEKVDGSGYPKGLRGDEIPLQARVVAVADAFDAMTSGRSYQPAVSREAALAELWRCAGSHFDTRCVQAFATVMHKLGDTIEELPAHVGHSHSHSLAA